MRDLIKKVYSFVTYYANWLAKIIEGTVYHFKNIFYNKKDYLEKMKSGEILYNDLLKEKDKYFIIIDKGIGDTIIVAAMANRLKHKNIYFIVPKHHKDIPLLYSYVKGVKIYGKKDLNSLTFYICRKKLYDNKNVFYAFFPMKVARSGMRFWSSAEYSKKTVLSNRFKQYVFKSNENIELDNPIIDISKKELQILKNKYGITKNSILIIPHAYTEINLPISFWEKLVCKLKKQGYTVFTNIGNKNDEVVVKGTKEFFSSLLDLCYLSNTFDKIIALRSGVCELLASCNSNLIVINRREKNYESWDDVSIFNKIPRTENYYVNDKKHDEIVNDLLKTVGSDKNEF